MPRGPPPTTPRADPQQHPSAQLVLAVDESPQVRPAIRVLRPAGIDDDRADRHLRFRQPTDPPLVQILSAIPPAHTLLRGHAVLVHRRSHLIAPAAVAGSQPPRRHGLLGLGVRRGVQRRQPPCQQRVPRFVHFADKYVDPRVPHHLPRIAVPFQVDRHCHPVGPDVKHRLVPQMPARLGADHDQRPVLLVLHHDRVGRRGEFRPRLRKHPQADPDRHRQRVRLEPVLLRGAGVPHPRGLKAQLRRSDLRRQIPFVRLEFHLCLCHRYKLTGRPRRPRTIGPVCLRGHGRSFQAKD